MVSGRTAKKVSILDETIRKLFIKPYSYATISMINKSVRIKS